MLALTSLASLTAVGGCARSVAESPPARQPVQAPDGNTAGTTGSAAGMGMGGSTASSTGTGTGTGTSGMTGTTGTTATSTGATGSTGGTTSTTSTTSTTGGPDAGMMDAAADTGMSCMAPLVGCAGQCVDTWTNDDHCGGCDTPCDDPGTHCAGSSCVCDDNAVLCNGTCESRQDVDASCTPCASTCGEGLICEGGACVCTGGTSLCGGACVDLATSNDHCGSCDAACTAGLRCENRSCACSSGETCGGVCTDTQTDVEHCGGCDQPCALVCSGGSCGTGGLACDVYENGGHTYVYCKTSSLHETWEGARAVCQGLGLDLAVIETSAEQAFLDTMGSSGHNWVGLQDLDQDGEFHWIVPGGALEGPVPDFGGWANGWDSGEPEAGKDCVNYYTDDFRTWACGDEENFFCESY